MLGVVRGRYTMLTVEEIEKRVALIRAMSWDRELAHVGEDNLRRDVLAAIADGTAEDPARCAAAALKTREINFVRCYA